MNDVAATHDESPLPRLAPRAPDSHKGTFGRVLLVGGSEGMTGAIALSGMAALRSGAGLVQLAVPRTSQAIVAALEPSYMTVALTADDEGRLADNARTRRQLGELAQPATACAVGPGLDRSPGLTELVGWLYATLAQPLVCDADALNALAERRTRLPQHIAPRILTPHPGEFVRLIGGSERIDPNARVEMATQFARDTETIVVLKGHQTCVTDGRRYWLNSTGNPGMATGGTGDVLTGVITALVGQGLGPYDAARLGVFVHGLAGDLAVETLGQVSLIAHDLIGHLPRAFQRAAAK